MLNTLCKDVVTKLAITSLLATVLLSVVGCMTTDDNVLEVDSFHQKGIIRNGIIRNGIIRNGIIRNGIIRNGTTIETIAFNGFSFDPTSSVGISVQGQGLDAQAIDGLEINGTGTNGILVNGTTVDEEQEINLLVLLRYAVECALPPGQSATIIDSLGTPYDFEGAMGLAAAWRTGALPALDRQYVSACLAARSNQIGDTVQISIRGGNVTTTPVELATYTHAEGSFWGDVFDADTSITTCAAQGGGISGRVCTTGDCGFAYAGSCADVCATQDATDGHYTGCNGQSAVITTYLPITNRVEFGKDHGCLIQDGMPWCWGKNSMGQLGDGTNIDRPTPAPRDMGNLRVAEIAAGAHHTCARLDNGNVYCTGDNEYGQLGIGSTELAAYEVQHVTELDDDTISIAAGSKHSCALKSDGTLRCWGDNFHGQLGDGTTITRSTPVAIESLGDSVVRLGMDDSADHTCVVTADGSLACWGWNAAGQLGIGTTTDQSEPVLVDQDAYGNALDQVIDVCAGSLHTCALRANGDVLCFGSNDKGRLGNAAIASSMETRPVRVDLPAPAIQGSLSCGTDHSCAILDNGEAYCWGGNEYGQLGNGSYDAKGSAPAPVLGLSQAVTSISADAYRSCAVLDNGSVLCWGQDSTNSLVAGVDASMPAELSVPALDTYAPASFTVTFDDAGSTVGSWETHMAADLDHYEIYRNGQFLTTLGSNKVSGTDRNLAAGTYCYKMRAVFGDGTASAFTQEICGTVN